MNDVCVITGGGSGMGLSAALHMPKDKIIIVSGRTVSKLERAIGQLEKIAEYMRMPVVKGYSRWFGDRCSFADFDEKIEEIREFFRRRASYIVPDVKEACEM